MRDAFEGFIKNGEMPNQGIVAVKVERRSNLFGDLGDRNLLTVKLPVLIFKEMHLALSLSSE
jgi:hypothetical protein